MPTLHTSHTQNTCSVYSTRRNSQKSYSLHPAHALSEKSTPTHSRRNSRCIIEAEKVINCLFRRTPCKIYYANTLDKLPKPNTRRPKGIYISCPDCFCKYDQICKPTVAHENPKIKIVISSEQLKRQATQRSTQINNAFKHEYNSYEELI